MRSLEIEVGDPASDFGACMIEIEERDLVDQFIAHSLVETLDEAVLHRLSRRNEVVCVPETLSELIT